jgi:tetratricopeptide (TPR) repeat protein
VNAERLADWQRQAERALAERRYRAAHGLCLQILEADPGWAQAYYLLGVLAAEHANHAGALPLYLKAIDRAPGNARYHAFFAKSLLALERPDDARRAAQRAVELGARDALTADTIGVVLARAGHHRDAAAQFERAVQLAPEHADHAYNLATELQFLGEFDRAEAQLRAVLGRSPGHYRARAALCQLRRGKLSGEDLADLERAFTTADEAEAIARLGHALATAAESRGAWPAALAWLDRAKQPRRATAAAHYERLFETAHTTIEAASDAIPTRATAPVARAPLFVVGMPRSGTTLVDRILSSHPEVRSLGETGAFALALKRATGTSTRFVLDPETLAAVEPGAFAGIGRAYLDATAALASGARFTVDKTPLNFFYGALLLAALPEARIVCVRRNPMDTITGNYRQLFASRLAWYYDYTRDLESTARYYVAFDALIAAFREALPAEQFTEVHYEALVADQEGTTRRLLAFCGLDWHDACLHFEQNPEPVATASSVQVRRPLYASAIGRWRHYGDGVEPALAVLRAAGIPT